MDTDNVRNINHMIYRKDRCVPSEHYVYHNKVLTSLM